MENHELTPNLPPDDPNPGVTQDNLDDIYGKNAEPEVTEPAPELTAAQQRIAELEEKIALLGDPARPQPGGMSPEVAAMFDQSNRQLQALTQTIANLVGRPVVANIPAAPEREMTQEEMIEAFKANPKGFIANLANAEMNRRIPAANQVLLRKMEEIANQFQSSQEAGAAIVNEVVSSRALDSMTDDVLDRCAELGLDKEETSQMLDRVNETLKAELKSGRVDDYFLRDRQGYVRGNRLDALVDRVFGMASKGLMTRAEARAEERRREKASGTFSMIPGGRSMIPNPQRPMTTEEMVLANIEANEGKRRRR